MRRTKIVCTIGPATEGVENAKRLIEAGMDVARLNFSHGNPDTHRRSYEAIRRASLETGKPVAILGDLCGPKIRLGEIAGGAVDVADNAQICITTETVPGTAERINTNFEHLPNDVSPGTSIFIDDGNIELVVESVTGKDVICKVVAGGTIRSRKGLNIPRAGLSTPALTPDDERYIEFGKEIGVDYFALSFVRRPEDVIHAKNLAGDIPVIAKIEKPEAIDVLGEIADVADGMMVARGDLGVELGFEKVPMHQKSMIREMNKRAKPVITATQMLESMISNPQPTRAEVSDIANAVLDGTDAVMLSAESAMGKYPFRAVRTMARIIEDVEETAAMNGMLQTTRQVAKPTFSNAIADAAARAAVQLNLRVVAVFTEQGRSASYVCAFRPHAAIVAFTPSERTLHKLALYRGVTPISLCWDHNKENFVPIAEEAVLQRGMASVGDEMVIVYGNPDANSGTRTLRLWRIGKPG